MAGMSADAVMMRNNFNLYYIFLSKGLYEDAFLILKSFIILCDDEDSYKQLEVIEKGSDNPLKVGIFELARLAYDILMGNWILVPTPNGFKTISSNELRGLIRDYKCRMNVLMNFAAQKFASRGMQLPVAPVFDIPSNVFGSGEVQAAMEVPDIGSGPIIKQG